MLTTNGAVEAISQRRRFIPPRLEAEDEIVRRGAGKFAILLILTLF